MILRYQFYSLCSKWSFYGGVIHVLSQCRCDSSNPFSNHWILPLITLASTLRSALQVFTFPHWSHSSSSKCQASNHSSNRFFLGMSSCFSNSPPQGSIIPLFPSISVLLRASKCSSSKCFPKNLHNCIDRAGQHIQFWNLLKPGRGCYIQESDLSVVVIKDVHFDFLVISVNVLCQILLLGIYILPFITLVNGAPLWTP